MAQRRRSKPDLPQAKRVPYRHERIHLAKSPWTDCQPHIALAWICQERRQFEQARRHIDCAFAINPNDAEALARRGMLLNLQGEPEAGKACVEAAIRLNPQHPDSYFLFLSLSFFMIRDYDEAIRFREMVVAGFPDMLGIQAALDAQAGDLPRATRTLQEFLRQYPLHWKEPPSARRFNDLFAFKRQEDAQHLFEGLCKAGMPE